MDITAFGIHWRRVFYIEQKSLWKDCSSGRPDDSVGYIWITIQRAEAPFKECTIRVLRKDNIYQYIQLRIAVLRVDEHNKPKTVLTMASDVGEIMNLREKIELQLDKLDIISYKNSHELRGPVATILGLIKLIEHDNFDWSL